MKYTIEKQDEYAVLTLQEENLNSLKAPDLKAEFFVLENAGVKNLILNLEQVKYIDSSGLSAILTGNRLWTERDGLFVLCQVLHPSVMTLIRLSKLDTVLMIAEDLAAAQKAVMMQALKQEMQEAPEEEEEED